MLFFPFSPLFYFFFFFFFNDTATTEIYTLSLHDALPIYLVAVENGGSVVVSSDQFYGAPRNLLMPYRPKNMGDGWETKRRRGPGHDWIILKLGAPGSIRKIEVDTNHFKGNYPDTCSIEGCNAPAAAIKDLIDGSVRWRKILPKTKLRANERHLFERQLAKIDNCSHVRLNIYPDGG